MKNITTKIYYQKPYNWENFYNFRVQRLIKNIEWITESSYGSNFYNTNYYGKFTIFYEKELDYFLVDISISNPDFGEEIIEIIKRMLDTDRNIKLIEKKLKTEFPNIKIESGIRIPGLMSFFEAGIKAICGQQVSIKRATLLANQVVEICNKKIGGLYIFPEPIDIKDMNFELLKCMKSTKNTLKEFSIWCENNKGNEDINQILKIKGIGAWTVNYIKIRAFCDTNIWIENDLGIKKAIKKFENIDPLKSYPYATYLSLHLWNNLKL